MINCKALAEKSLFVSAKGEIVPCCHIYDGGHEPGYALKQIMKDENFEGLVEAWKLPSPNRISYQCYVICDDSQTSNPKNMKNFDGQWKIIHLLKDTDK